MGFRTRNAREVKPSWIAQTGIVESSSSEAMSAAYGLGVLEHSDYERTYMDELYSEQKERAYELGIELPRLEAWQFDRGLETIDAAPGPFGYTPDRQALREARTQLEQLKTDHPDKGFLTFDEMQTRVAEDAKAKRAVNEEIVSREGPGLFGVRWGAAAGSLGAGITEPLNIVSMVATAPLATGNIARVIGVEAASAVGSQAIVEQSTVDFRRRQGFTDEEIFEQSLENILIAGAFGAGLGGAGELIAKGLRYGAKRLRASRNAVEGTTALTAPQGTLNPQTPVSGASRALSIDMPNVRLDWQQRMTSDDPTVRFEALEQAERLRPYLDPDAKTDLDILQAVESIQRSSIFTDLTPETLQSHTRLLDAGLNTIERMEVDERLLQPLPHGTRVAYREGRIPEPTTKAEALVRKIDAGERIFANELRDTIGKKAYAEYKAARDERLAATNMSDSEKAIQPVDTELARQFLERKHGEAIAPLTKMLEETPETEILVEHLKNGDTWTIDANRVSTEAERMDQELAFREDDAWQATELEQLQRMVTEDPDFVFDFELEEIDGVLEERQMTAQEILDDLAEEEKAIAEFEACVLKGV